MVTVHLLQSDDPESKVRAGRYLICEVGINLKIALEVTYLISYHVKLERDGKEGNTSFWS